tara:strand:+ start:2608 stop:2754 length:147 start_codon:yes stop_codon:yes gene_type:complete
MNQKKKIFIIWVFLVILWNFGVPGAPPIYDVLVAVVLSFFPVWLKRIL